jgi:hypothetical protein
MRIFYINRRLNLLIEAFAMRGVQSILGHIPTSPSEFPNYNPKDRIFYEMSFANIGRELNAEFPSENPLTQKQIKRLGLELRDDE